MLTITVNNQTANQSSDGENITGIALNINSNITGAALAGSNAPVDLIDITSKTAVTDLGPGAMSDWTAATSLSQITLTDIGGGPPAYGIIGAPGSNGDYSNAGGSLTNNAGKQPYAQETAVFTVDLTGTNVSLASITGVEIGFGTQGNNYIGATVVQNVATPEPGTFGLSGMMAMVVGLAMWRRPKRCSCRS